MAAMHLFPNTPDVMKICGFIAQLDHPVERSLA
jgi:hypothetical protein